MVQFITKNCSRITRKSLIQKRRVDMQKISKLLKAIVEGGEAVTKTKLLLDGRGADFFIDNGFLTIVARMHCPDIPAIMDLILKKQGTNIAITEETLIAAVGNIKKIMITAVGNGNHGSTIIKKLLEKQGANIVITEEIVIVAIGNISRGPEIIRVLLEKRGADINITEKVMKEVSVHRSIKKLLGKDLNFHRDITMQLLGKRREGMEVTEEPVTIIISATKFPIQALTLLFEKQGEKLRVTEGTVRIVEEEKILFAQNLLKRTKDNIQRYSCGGTGSTG
ncbi:hypothetical protein BHYA_0099g00350 [Botrytis hyacinthi]|uniref:Uncharacterized protein n=1 Tax=Botrytis hyacinthi TaxID=278943 RepID=A0A4Z1GKE9_9HELO|nr:hypothetical protein BHYA_0099g00350 [Botrytis hyacinthi]